MIIPKSSAHAARTYGFWVMIGCALYALNHVVPEQNPEDDLWWWVLAGCALFGGIGFLIYRSADRRIRARDVLRDKSN